MDQITEREVHSIVGIFLGSADLVESRERLFSSLELPLSSLVELKRSVALDLSGSFGFFTQTLVKWISYKSSSATITELLAILRRENFNSVADELAEVWLQDHPNYNLSGGLSPGNAGNDRHAWLVPPLKAAMRKSNTEPISGEYHRVIIRDNMSTLCDTTEITMRLLDTCLEQSILTRDHVEEIESSGPGYNRSRKFYNMIARIDSERFVKLLEIMKEPNTMQSSQVIAILSRNAAFTDRHSYAQPTDSVGISLWFEVVKPPTSFMRPTTELEILHNLLIRADIRRFASSKLTALVGVQEIGKTSFVRKYLDTYSSHFQSVIWINAETNKAMREAFQRLLEVHLTNIAPHSMNKSLGEVVQVVYDYFSNQSCLFVFDNVAEFTGTENSVDLFLPTTMKHPSKVPNILLVSQLKDVRDQVETTMELNPLPESVAVNYIRNRLLLHDQRSLDLIRSAAQKLRYLPTGIVECISFVETHKDFNKHPIEEYLQLLNKSESSIWFEVGEPPLHFTGRENELSKLHDMIRRNEGRKADSSGNMLSELTLIVGLGGIGKTSFAREYARTLGNEYFNGNVIWVNSETRNSMELLFNKLAKKLNIKTYLTGESVLRSTACILEDIYDYFSSRKCLFIFDNVVDYTGSEGSVYNFFPSFNKPPTIRPSILLTSRKHLRLEMSSIELNLFTKDQSVKLLCIQENYNVELDVMQELASKLQYLPLALQQAASHIQKIKVSHQLLGNQSGNSAIKEYLNIFKNNAYQVLGEYPRIGFEYGETVMVTWLSTLEKIQTEPHGSAAVEIIKILSYFYPDEIETNIFNQKFTITEIQEAFLLLANYSMIQAKAGTVSVHRLVQQVIRIQEKKYNNEINLIRSALEVTQRCTWEFVIHRARIWSYTLEHEELVQQFTDYGLNICSCLAFDEPEQHETFHNTVVKFKALISGSDSVRIQWELMYSKLLNLTSSKNDHTNEIVGIFENELRELNMAQVDQFNSMKSRAVPETLIRYGRLRQCKKIVEEIRQMYTIFVEYFNKEKNADNVIYCVKIAIDCFMELEMANEALEFANRVNKFWTETYGWNNPERMALVNAINNCIRQCNDIDITRKPTSLYSN